MRVFTVSSFDYTPKGRGGAIGRFRGFDLWGRRWGFDRSTVYVETERYLDRYILYVNGRTVRLHKFYRGDDDRASHTHPFSFITFPLGGYVERVYCRGTFLEERAVRRWRFHFRYAGFEHYVVRGIDSCTFWTFVATGVKTGTWGFYPEPNVFVNWRDWE
jgi:hypothetical protein